MNWTGGRLHRHSKANANALVKSQRQHFARARLQAQTRQHSQSSLAFSIFNGRFDAREPANKISTESDRRKRKAGDIQDELQKRPEAPASRETSYDCIVKCQRRSPRNATNTLDDVKQDLLSRSDWIGLGKTRPVKMQFVSPDEMEKIGKRRKVTLKDHNRRDQARNTVHALHNLIQPFQGFRSPGLSPMANVDDVSIRIGSNVHQTQRTPSTRPQDRPYPHSSITSSTEPILRDRVEEPHVSNNASSLRQSANSLLKISARDGFHEAGDNGENRYAAAMLPLDQVRNLSSFDEVKDRSSSLPRQALSFPISECPGRSLLRQDAEPFMQLQAHGQTVISDGLGQINANKSDPSAQSARRCTPAGPNTPSWQVRGSLATPPSVPQPQPAIAGNGSEIDGLGAFTQPFDSEGFRILQAALEVRGREVNEAVPSRAEFFYARRPLFTLERQVELETQTLDCKGQIPAAKEGLLPSGPTTSPFTFTSENDKEHQAPRAHLRRPNQPKRMYTEAFPDFEVAEDPHAPSHNPNLWSRPSKDPRRGVNPVKECADSLTKRSEGGRSANDEPLHHTGRQSEQQPRIVAPDVLNSKSATPSRDPHIFPSLERAVPTARSKADEKEAWMKFVFADHFQQMQSKFAFAPSRVRHDEPKYEKEPGLACDLPVDQYNFLEEAPWSYTTGSSSPTMTCKSATNVTLFRHRTPSARSPSQVAQSETDFLTQMSPMEGMLDERINDLSVYNNPARTVRSFVQYPDIWPTITSGGANSLDQQFGPEPSVLHANVSLENASVRHLHTWKKASDENKANRNQESHYE